MDLQKMNTLSLTFGRALERWSPGAATRASNSPAGGGTRRSAAATRRGLFPLFYHSDRGSNFPRQARVYLKDIEKLLTGQVCRATHLQCHCQGKRVPPGTQENGPRTRGTGSRELARTGPPAGVRRRCGFQQRPLRRGSRGGAAQLSLHSGHYRASPGASALSARNPLHSAHDDRSRAQSDGHRYSPRRHHRRILFHRSWHRCGHRRNGQHRHSASRSIMA